MQIPQPPHAPPRRRLEAAFTLIEVMIACGILFIALFAILGLVSNTLRNAQALRHIPVDAGMVAAQVLGKTNRMTIGTDSGDFGNIYPDCSWETDTEEAGTNGLVQVDIVVRRRGQADPVDKLSILVFDPTLQNRIGPPRKP